ncbi:hypothetical protein [Propionivibrio dicarboxylicus]|uniref:Ubiquitin-activating enzyme E1 FCCH domain-containing protein n=1 Tax=Propionivibrio dicarboxylicus TaxID=83767 RepID=A0A1G8APF3_9RHOO|nr:hypothetical protein [Propionivibrio dicarboxylicus]SDH22891.1 hypothetical protein SAMN05660652_01456 [Propionivibrio dicarboxylicus]
MNLKTLARSFSGGIIGPELYGRVDLAKLQTGLAEANNFWVLPHGPVQNRPGFQYVNEVKDSTKKVRVVPFSFNTEQTFVLEFGDQYIRWHTNGGTLLETGLTITGISKANPGVLTYTGTDPANGDWMYLSSIVGMAELNGRYAKVKNVNAVANTFELSDTHGGANIDTSGFTAYTSGGTAARVYEIATPYLEADLFDLHFVQSADVLTIVHPTYAPRELRRLGATNWQLSTISFIPTIGTPTAPTVTSSGAGSTTYTYKTTALASDTLEESYASPSTAVTGVALTTSGSYNTITPATVTGAVRYNIYKLASGLWGYIGQTDGSAFKDDNITADVSQTPPEPNDPLSGAGNFPGAVGYHGQRRCFGGTNNKPQNFWATRSATENNLSYSIPTRDDDAIAFRVTAREVNRIRHIVSLDQLLFLTSGGEWKVAPQNSDVLTPTSADPKQFGAEGASNVQPVIAASSVIYVQESGSRLREMKANIYDTSSLDVRDISILAPHLFDDYSVGDLAYAKTPNKMVWCVRSDGTLLGLTYLPEHDVLGWHTHTTDGSFESVACVKEGSEHALYTVAKRHINSRDVRYIERLHSRRFSDPADAFFVDAGLTYSGTATSTITGLWHLEGEEVAVLADAGEHNRVTVTDGAIELDAKASTVHVGLPITADLKTLPLSFEAEAAGQGLTKNVSEVYLRVKDSLGYEVGPNFDELQPTTQRSGEDYGAPPEFVTGVEQITIMPEWGQDAQVCVRQSAPLPVTILSMAFEVTVGA